MNLRKFGKTGFDVFPIGFGCMRFPTKDGAIDQDEAIRMLRYAIDNGVNYVDTAYPYHGGESELVVGKALKDGYREKVKLATKSPVWLINEPDDFDRLLDEQMEKLQTNFIDFYLLHALDKDRWDNTIIKFGLLDKMKKAKEDGKIGNIGFSYHDKPEHYEEMVTGFDHWDFAQIQLNYLNEDYQAGLAGLKLLEERNIGVVIMEPLLGGKLANVSNKITDIFQQTNKERSAVEWALDYLWNYEGIGVLLSGMSTMEQVEDNILYAKRSKPSMFSKEENDTIKKVQEKFKEIQAVPCTKCQYCMPCPVGVNIPRNFDIINEMYMFENEKDMKDRYKKLTEKEDSKESALHCVDCKKCISLCPQNINIPVELKKVHETLS